MTDYWPLMVTFFLGGMISEWGRWYFQGYLKHRMKKYVDKLPFHRSEEKEGGGGGFSGGGGGGGGF